MTWEEAFEQHKQAVGRAVHESWAAEKQRQGFADHPFTRCWVHHVDETCLHQLGISGCHSNYCPLPEDKHHPDMLDYDDLAPNIQEYDIQTGLVGFRLGYQAASIAFAVLED